MNFEFLVFQGLNSDPDLPTAGFVHASDVCSYLSRWSTIDFYIIAKGHRFDHIGCEASAFEEKRLEFHRALLDA